jgi:hypothetical protein
MGRRRRLTPAELREAANSLNGVLGGIESGELTAPAAVVHRLEGAVLVLRALAEGGLPTADTLGFTRNDHIV